MVFVVSDVWLPKVFCGVCCVVESRINTCAGKFAPKHTTMGRQARPGIKFDISIDSKLTRALCVVTQIICSKVVPL